MKSEKELLKEREKLLEELAGIVEIQRGSLSWACSAFFGAKRGETIKRDTE